MKFAARNRVESHLVGGTTEILLRDPDASTIRETVPGSSYEPGTVSVLTALLRRRKATFVDVGALYGYFSIYAAKLNPACRVIAFEPNPAFSQVLRENVALNRVEVECQALALSQQPEMLLMREKTVAMPQKSFLPGAVQLARATLRPRRGNRSSSPSTPSPEGNRLGYGRWAKESLRHFARGLTAGSDDIAADAIDFDRWAAENEVRATVAKIDVHGAEGMVLAGMPVALRDDLEAVLVEVHTEGMLVQHDHREILSMLTDAGFALYEVEDFRRAAEPRLLPLVGERAEQFTDPARWTVKEMLLMRMIVAVKGDAFSRLAIEASDP